MSTITTNEDVEDHRNLLDWSPAPRDILINGTLHHMPIDMRFNDGHMLSIIVYSVLMVFSAISNFTVLVLILRRRRKTPSRINTTLMHLAIADLLVTFLMMPLEIGWAYTVSWRAGDAMCRIMAFFRTFGLYLSSFILVCISMDRYYAVLKPLHLTELDKRGKFMLSAAWIGATICSVPQMLVFHVEAHPNITWYEQCITYNVMPSYTHEVLYGVFGMMMMYTFPLVVIIFSYASILMEIYKRTRTNLGADRIRRSSLGFLGRAKIRTLKMTIIIVVVFFVCWTPYYVMTVWYWYDRPSAVHVDQRVQRGLFLFACTNSCMNPIVYGAFNIRARRAGTQTNSQNNTGIALLADADGRKSFRFANGTHRSASMMMADGGGGGCAAADGRRAGSAKGNYVTVAGGGDWPPTGSVNRRPHYNHIRFGKEQSHVSYAGDTFL